MRLGEIKKLCKASGCVRLFDENKIVDQTEDDVTVFPQPKMVEINLKKRRKT